MSIPVIDIRPDHWQIVRHILRRHVPQYEVWAFGSRAKWTAKPHSDLDLAVITDKPLPLSVSAALADDFSESNLPWKVDVVDWAATSDSFRIVIERDKVVVQEVRPGSVGVREWRQLQDVVDEILDRRGVTPIKLGGDFASTGHRVISAKVIKDGRVDLGADEARYVDSDIYRKWMRRPLRSDDVIMTSEAPLGELAYLDRDVDWVLGQRLFAIRPRPHVLSGRFLYYALSAPDVRDSLMARSSGTTVVGIRQAELRKVEIPVPPIEEQHAIAHILGTLDDKIELNRKQNETLEAMGRALFKAWFVDFEPVRAKMQRRWQRGQSLPGLPAHLYDLFPNRLVESELGEIPEGWRMGSLGEVAVHPRRSVQPSEIKDETPYIALEHMPKRSIALAEWGVANGLESNKYEFKHGEILFGKLRPYFHKVGVAPINGVCSTDIVVIAPKLPEWFGFVLAHSSSDAFVEYTNAGSTGTKMPRTSWSEMARYKVALPHESIAAEFNQHIKAASNEITTKIHESKSLAQLRDIILPKLISGELRIADAERFLERAEVPATTTGDCHDH